MTYLSGPVVQIASFGAARDVRDALDLLNEVRALKGKGDGLAPPFLDPDTQQIREDCARLHDFGVAANSPGRTQNSASTMTVHEAMQRFGLPESTVKYQCAAVWAPAGKARKVAGRWQIDTDVSYTARGR
jgi:hypothetical protein